jgi:hypothetical protein
VGQAVAQPLALRVVNERASLEERRHQVRTRQDEHDIPLDRAGQAAALAGVHMNHDQADEELADTLPAERIAEQEVERARDGERH